MTAFILQLHEAGCLLLGDIAKVKEMFHSLRIPWIVT